MKSDNMIERDIQEAIMDRVLLLYLVAKSRKKGYNVSGHIKLQKLLYKTEERMYVSKYKGLNYSFIRWNFGPFSQEIYSDVKDLGENGFLKVRPGEVIDISDDGVQLINALGEVLEKNRKFKEIIDRVINEFGPLKGDQIKDAMYSYPKIGERKLIAEIKKGELILPRLVDSEAVDRFWIDEKWFETLRILFDPALYKSMKEGLKALKTEEGKPFIPVLE